MMVTLNEKHIGKTLNTKGFQFIIGKAEDKDRYFITTPNYRNNNAIFAGTLQRGLEHSVVVICKTLENIFLHVQKLPRVGDTYHDFDGSGKVRTIVKIGTTGTRWFVETRTRTQTMHAHVNVDTGTLEAVVGLAIVNEADAIVENFECDEFVFLEQKNEGIMVDDRKVSHDVLTWKGVLRSEETQLELVKNEEPIQSPQV